MPSIKSRPWFADTEKGKEIKRKLQLMTEDDAYNTTATYSANTQLHPDNLITFVDKHMTYLVGHPLLDPDKYLANIRLVTRLR